MSKYTSIRWQQLLNPHTWGRTHCILGAAQPVLGIISPPHPRLGTPMHAGSSPPYRGLPSNQCWCMLGTIVVTTLPSPLAWAPQGTLGTLVAANHHHTHPQTLGRPSAYWEVSPLRGGEHCYSISITCGRRDLRPPRPCPHLQELEELVLFRINAHLPGHTERPGGSVHRTLSNRSSLRRLRSHHATQEAPPSPESARAFPGLGMGRVTSSNSDRLL